MTVGPEYVAAWRDLKKRRWTLLLVFIGYVPGVFLLWIALGVVSQPLRPEVRALRIAQGRPFPLTAPERRASERSEFRQNWAGIAAECAALFRPT